MARVSCLAAFAAVLHAAPLSRPLAPDPDPAFPLALQQQQQPQVQQQQHVERGSAAEVDSVAEALGRIPIWDDGISGGGWHRTVNAMDEETGLASSDPSKPVRLGTALDEMRRDMNASADPCADFYNYACGSWIASTTLAADEVSISRGFTNLGKRRDLTLHQMLAQNDTPQLSSYMAECVGWESRNDRQAVPVQPWLEGLFS